MVGHIYALNKSADAAMSVKWDVRARSPKAVPRLCSPCSRLRSGARGVVCRLQRCLPALGRAALLLRCHRLLRPAQGRRHPGAAATAKDSEREIDSDNESERAWTHSVALTVPASSNLCIVEFVPATSALGVLIDTRLHRTLAIQKNVTPCAGSHQDVTAASVFSRSIDSSSHSQKDARYERCRTSFSSASDTPHRCRKESLRAHSRIDRARADHTFVPGTRRTWCLRSAASRAPTH